MRYRINARINQNELNPMPLPERLRALPSFDPPLGGWMRVSQRMQRRRQRYLQAGTGLALAASLLVAVGLIKPLPSFTGGGWEGGAPPPQSPPARGGGGQIAQLINRSQRLEHRLAQARPQVAVWDSSRANRAAALETRLRQVDARLNYSLPGETDSSAALWRDRVELMNALVELHEPQAPALQYASYQY